MSWLGRKTLWGMVVAVSFAGIALQNARAELQISELVDLLYFQGAGAYDLDPDPDDWDGDGLTNYEEGLWGTDPCDPDSDDDLLLDGEEAYVYSTDPLDPLTDEDTLRDGLEVLVYGTDPTKWSTDGDPYSDGLELRGNACAEDPPEGMSDVLPPGDNVFVAAYPVIEVTVDENISVEEIPVITFGDETWEVGTVGNGMKIRTHGSRSQKGFSHFVSWSV